MVRIKHIFYRSGMRYVTVAKYMQMTAFKPPETIQHNLITWSSNGLLIVEAGYPWDGPSGPPGFITDLLFLGWLYKLFFLKKFMRPSLVHDVGYELINAGLLDTSYRELFDQLLYEMCIEDGMTKPRAKMIYRAVRAGGGAAVRRGRETLVAP